MPACMEIVLIPVSDKLHIFAVMHLFSTVVHLPGIYLFIFRHRELHFLLFHLFNMNAYKRRDRERHRGQFCFLVPTSNFQTSPVILQTGLCCTLGLS